MNFMQIEPASVENGIGFRVALFVSGCTLKCAGCHNQESWSFDAGCQFAGKYKEAFFKALEMPWCKGVTLTGGHPLEFRNISDVNKLIHEIRDGYPDKDIWLYTGYKLEPNDFERKDVFGDTITNCDVIVDGRFEQAKKDLSLAFRGSSNQRIIDVKETIKRKQIVELTV